MARHAGSVQVEQTVAVEVMVGQGGSANAKEALEQYQVRKRSDHLFCLLRTNLATMEVTITKDFILTKW